MKNSKINRDLLKSVAIGMKRDFERFNKTKAKNGEMPVSFFSFADKYMNYRSSLTKKGIIIGVIISLALALALSFVTLGIPESVAQWVINAVLIAIALFFSYLSYEESEKMIADAAKKIITVCKDKNIDIYNYIENEYWKK